MKNDVLQRVMDIIAYYSMTKSSFAAKINMEQTTVNNQLIGKRGISIDLILGTLYSFPDISAEWLLRGRGEMLNNENHATQSDAFNKEFIVCVDENGFLKLKKK